jgi:hypothetical protein
MKSVFVYCICLQFYNDNYNINFFSTVNEVLQSDITNKLNLQTRQSYFGIKVFNCLPADIKELSDDIKCFKNALKRFFHLHSFYTVDEYFNYNIMN